MSERRAMLESAAQAPAAVLSDIEDAAVLSDIDDAAVLSEIEDAAQLENYPHLVLAVEPVSRDGSTIGRGDDSNAHRLESLEGQLSILKDRMSSLLGLTYSLRTARNQQVKEELLGLW